MTVTTCARNSRSSSVGIMLPLVRSAAESMLLPLPPPSSGGLSIFVPRVPHGAAELVDCCAIRCSRRQSPRSTFWTPPVSVCPSTRGGHRRPPKIGRRHLSCRRPRLTAFVSKCARFRHQLPTFPLPEPLMRSSRPKTCMHSIRAAPRPL